MTRGVAISEYRTASYSGVDRIRMCTFSGICLTLSMLITIREEEPPGKLKMKGIYLK